MSEYLTYIAIFVLLLEVGAAYVASTMGNFSERDYRKQYRKEYKG